MSTPPIKNPGSFEIFISYSRRDNVPASDGEPGWVTALRDEILMDQRRFSTEPLRIFFDTSDIKGMDDWRHRILDGLRHSKILLVCLSPNYFKSVYCWWEWEEYHRRQVHQLIGHESVAPVYFVEVPGSDEYENAAQVDKWLSEIERANYAADLRPWFPLGATALRDEAVRLRIFESHEQSGKCCTEPIWTIALRVDLAIIWDTISVEKR